MFQLMRISENVHPKVQNNERVFGVWRWISKGSGQLLISVASAQLSASLYVAVIRYPWGEAATLAEIFFNSLFAYVCGLLQIFASNAYF